MGHATKPSEDTNGRTCQCQLSRPGSIRRRFLPSVTTSMPRINRLLARQAAPPGGSACPTIVKTGVPLVAQAVPPALRDYFTASEGAEVLISPAPLER